MYRNAGVILKFLSPYSPDFNPIELAFSAIKAQIRRNGQFIRDAMHSTASDQDAVNRLYDAVMTVTPEDAYGWYKHCGYVV